MNEKQSELHLQMTIKAIQSIAREIEDDQRTVSLHLPNHKTIELATNIISEANKEKRHADNMKLINNSLRNIDHTLMRISQRL